MVTFGLRLFTKSCQKAISQADNRSWDIPNSFILFHQGHSVIFMTVLSADASISSIVYSGPMAQIQIAAPASAADFALSPLIPNDFTSSAEAWPIWVHI